MRIQLVFANYHCAEDITRCLNGITALEPEVDVDVTVVENSGDPVDLESIVRCPNLTLRSLFPKANVGYFGAMRYAFAEREPDVRYDWRGLCNPDIEFLDAEVFRVLDNLATAHRLGVVAPTIVSSASGLDQNPYMRLRPGASTVTRWRLIYSSYVLYLVNDWRSRVLPSSRRSSIIRKDTKVSHDEIYAPHGSLMFFTERFLADQKGALEAIPFLYCEELFIGEICRNANWRVLYVPEIVANHREHSTTALLPSRRRFELQASAVRDYLSYLENAAP